MSSSKEFPLENGNHATRVTFEGGEIVFWQDGECTVLSKAQFQEAIRLSIGNLFPINAIDEVLLARHTSDQILASISARELMLLKAASNNTEFLALIEDDHYFQTLVRSCICIAVMALRSVQGKSPPVQGEES